MSIRELFIMVGVCFLQILQTGAIVTATLSCVEGTFIYSALYEPQAKVLIFGLTFILIVTTGTLLYNYVTENKEGS